MQFLNIESGKIFPQQDPFEVSDQQLLDRILARLKRSLELDDLSESNFMEDLRLVDRLQALVSLQELR